MRNPPTRRWLAAALAPMLFTGVAAPAEGAWRCLAERAARDACCCHGAHTESTHARIAQRCCCEIDAQKTPAAPAQVAAGGGPAFDAGVLPAASATRVARASDRLAHLTPPVRAPSVGPPLILLKRSLLI